MSRRVSGGQNQQVVLRTLELRSAARTDEGVIPGLTTKIPADGVRYDAIGPDALTSSGGRSPQTLEDPDGSSSSPDPLI